jgi:hypothetical protein
MRRACAEMGAELREFNGENDHIHLLVHYPPNSRSPRWSTGSRAYRRTTCGKSSPATSAGTSCTVTCGPRRTSPRPAPAHHCRSSSNTSNSRNDPVRPMRFLPALN